jgi:hypothetical protein
MSKSCKLLRRSVPPGRRRYDAELRALGQKFDAAVRRLASLEMNHAAPISRIEGFLASMESLERAILATPAKSIAGIAVKARVAAHIVSNYWDVPLDRLDLDARAFRHLVESVCSAAEVSLPFPSDSASGRSPSDASGMIAKISNPEAPDLPRGPALTG